MAGCGANTDWISYLPREIIEKILNLLPCRDAIRTSILSRDWRYKWISMSDLNFGEGTGRKAGKADRHVRSINECLLRHQGPIRKFSVTALTLTVWRKIEQWLQLVSKHDIEELQVFRYPSLDFPRFPSCLFNCKKLTHLELSFCKLDVPPSFEGFLNLKVLKLSNIRFMDKNSIESLISKSPLLESLNLETYSPFISITFSAPKIKYISIECYCKDICLENSPVLVDMSLALYGDQRDCDLIKILSGAPNLEKLALRNFKHFKIGCYRGVLSTTFNHLKVITLTEFSLRVSSIPLVLELLMSAPNLEKLVIYNTYYPLPNDADSDFWQKEYLVGHCFMKLKVVEMSFILCMAPEIEFSKFILSNSPILEKMTIGTVERNHEIINDTVKKLQKLPRASAQVAVTFHGRDKNGI